MFDLRVAMKDACESTDGDSPLGIPGGYFNPLWTLFVAVLSVALFMFSRRLGKVVELIANAFATRILEPILGRAVWTVRGSLVLALKNAARRPLHEQAIIKEAIQSLCDARGDDATPQVPGDLKALAQELAASRSTQAAPRDAAEPREEENKAPFGGDVPLMDLKATQGTPLDDLELGVMEEEKDNKKLGKEMDPPPPSEKSAAAGVNDDKGQASGTVKAFAAWIDGMEKKEKEAFLSLFCETLVAKVSMARAEDARTFERDIIQVSFVGNVLIGIACLFEYYGVTWPEGSFYFCQLPYLTSIVSFRPFTLPMYSALTVAAHYTFVEVTFGHDPNLREPSGTLKYSPLPRSIVSLSALAVTYVLFGLWFLCGLVSSGPVMAAFAPVLLLLAWVLPMVVTYGPSTATDLILAYLRRKTVQEEEGEEQEEEQKTEQQRGDTKSDELSFRETVLVLKSATTQVNLLSPPHDFHPPLSSERGTVRLFMRVRDVTSCPHSRRPLWLPLGSLSLFSPPLFRALPWHLCTMARSSSPSCSQWVCCPYSRAASPGLRRPMTCSL